MANTAQQVNFSDVLSSLVSQYGVTKGPGASNNQMNIQDVMAIYNNLASQYAANSFDLGMAMNLYNQANNRIERQTAETRARQDNRMPKLSLTQRIIRIKLCRYWELFYLWHLGEREVLVLTDLWKVLMLYYLMI